MGATLAAQPFNFLLMDEVTNHFRSNLNVAQFVYYSLPDLKIVFVFVVHLAVLVGIALSKMEAVRCRPGQC